MSETPDVAPGEELLADPSDLSIRTGLAADDPELELALRRATHDFRAAVSHPVTRVTDDTIYLSGSGTASLQLPARPVIGTVDIMIDDTEIPATRYELGREAGLVRLKHGVWPDGLDNIAVTYTHGHLPTKIPGDIASAVLEAAELSLNTTAGVDQITTAGESVRLSANGTTTQWAATVARHGIGRGDRS